MPELAALRQAHLPVQEGGVGLTSSARVASTAYTGRQALAFGWVFTVASTSGLPALFECLTQLPLAKEFIVAVTKMKNMCYSGSAEGRSG